MQSISKWIQQRKRIILPPLSLSLYQSCFCFFIYFLFCFFVVPSFWVSHVLTSLLFTEYWIKECNKHWHDRHRFIYWFSAHVRKQSEIDFPPSYSDQFEHQKTVSINISREEASAVLLRIWDAVRVTCIINIRMHLMHGPSRVMLMWILSHGPRLLHFSI